MPGRPLKRPPESHRREADASSAGVAAFAECWPARMSAELLHVASPASGARVGRPAGRWLPISAGFGDSPPDPPGTFERHVEAVERLRRADRAGPGHPGCPRHRRLDRAAVGMRSPGRCRRPGDHQHGLLPRPSSGSRSPRRCEPRSRARPSWTAYSREAFGTAAGERPRPSCDRARAAHEVLRRRSVHTVDRPPPGCSTRLSLLRARRAQSPTSGSSTELRKCRRSILCGRRATSLLPVDYATHFSGANRAGSKLVLLEGASPLNLLRRRARAAAPRR